MPGSSSNEPAPASSAAGPLAGVRILTSARSSWAPTPPRCWATWARTWSRSSPRRRQPARGRPHAQSRHGPSAPAPEPQQALDRAGPEDARGPRGLPSAGRGLRRPALQHPPQAMARLGLSYEAVAARNPRIVYLGAYGFGEQGPYAGRPAYDDLIQGQAGIAALYARQSGGAALRAPDAGGSRRRPACRHRAGVGRAACPRQRAGSRSRFPCSRAWRT